MAESRLFLGMVVLVGLISGCSSIKESDTARTGMEQLLISSASDQALDKIDLNPIRGANTYVETKYLECVDKNYIILSLRQRLSRQGCKLTEKPEEADVIVEIASGAVGTDKNETFIGIPSLPLPPPSPISVPRMPLFNRVKAMGTAKLRVLAYDAKTKLALVDSDFVLARSDYRHWDILGAGPVVSGSVPNELYAYTGESESVLQSTSEIAKKTGDAVRK